MLRTLSCLVVASAAIFFLAFVPAASVATVHIKVIDFTDPSKAIAQATIQIDQVPRGFSDIEGSFTNLLPLTTEALYDLRVEKDFYFPCDQPKSLALRPGEQSSKTVRLWSFSAYRNLEDRLKGGNKIEQHKALEELQLLREAYPNFDKIEAFQELLPLEKSVQDQMPGTMLRNDGIEGASGLQPGGSPGFPLQPGDHQTNPGRPDLLQPGNLPTELKVPTNNQVIKSSGGGMEG
jgi:hypothetical protein